MRRFTNRQLHLQQQPSLENFIRTRCEGLSDAFNVHFAFDFALGAENPAFSNELVLTLDDILQNAAVLSMPDSIVDVGTYWTRRGLEIEVSTSAEQVGEESINSFHKQSVSLENGFTMSVYHARCPMGGTAWIIVQGHVARLRMVA